MPGVSDMAADIIRTDEQLRCALPAARIPHDFRRIAVRNMAKLAALRDKKGTNECARLSVNDRER